LYDALEGVLFSLQLQVYFLINSIDAALVDGQMGCLEVSLHVLVVVESRLLGLAVEGRLIV
jgi:hypothetical protein